MIDEQPNDEVEATLRRALRRQADSVEIRGDGLQLIRAATHTRHRSRRWQPILAAAAALIVIGGVAVGARVLRTGAEGDNGAASVAGGAQENSVADSALPNPAATSTLASKSATPGYAGEPLPVSVDTPLVWPYTNTKAAYDALSGMSDYAAPSSINPGGSTSSIASPQSTAVSFVAAALDTGTEPLSAVESSPSNLSTPGTDGTIVQVAGSSGAVISNVFLRAVVDDKAGTFTYAVVGATTTGGNDAGLTIDSPKEGNQTLALSGYLRGQVASQTSTLVVVTIVAGVIGAPTSYDLADVVQGNSWSLATKISSSPHGVVVLAEDSDGACVGLVATTVQG